MNNLECHVPSLSLKLDLRCCDQAALFGDHCEVLVMACGMPHRNLRLQMMGTSIIKITSATEGSKPVITPKIAVGTELMKLKNGTASRR